MEYPSSESSKPVQLEPSELGTKQYWDAVYAVELTNHAANPRDEGTVWFDDSDAEAKTIAFLERHASSSSSSSSSAPAGGREALALNKATTTFLDLGCGNGSLLFALRDAGWAGRLLGADYSEASVALAVQVGAARAAGLAHDADDDDDDDEEGQGGEEVGREEQERIRRGEAAGRVDGEAHEAPVQGPSKSGPPVDFIVWDVLAGPLDPVRAGGGGGGGGGASGEGNAGWDVVLDKGTFDAISLSDARDAQGRRVNEGYRERVLQLLRPGGVFLITSCNWTEAELKGWFERVDEVDGEPTARLVQVDSVEYKSFSFGGVKGQTISTLCFRKV